MVQNAPFAPSKPPLVSGNLIVKQLDTSSNSENEIAALDLAFPVFRQLDNEFFFPGGWQPVRTGLGSKVLFVGRGRERRYAGDKTLDRGRYWSVCNENDGFDYSTLLNELRAYHGYTSRCEVYIYDSTCDREKLVELHNKNVIDLGIILNIAQQQFERINHPFLLLMIKARQMGEKAKAAGLLPERLHVFLYGLRVKEIRIDNLFDLRSAQGRRWLFEQFLPFEIEQGAERRKNGNIRLYGKGPPSRIEDLIPILLSPEIGGANPFIQALGSWLRCNHCNGIVFPSARSDFSATECQGKLDDFRGWNFVDFRNSQPVDWKDHIGHIMDFDTYLGNFFSIKCTEGEGFASIEVEGLRRQNNGRFNTMAYHAREGTDPSLLDLSSGVLSILDISRETLDKISNEENETKDDP
jgi:hypothetical protein